MADILKNITDRLHGKVKEANFEGANIVLYTQNEDFFKTGEGKIKEIVNDIKKRIELRADSKLLKDKEETEKIIKEIVPSEAEITEIIFDFHRFFTDTVCLISVNFGSLYFRIRRDWLVVDRDPWPNIACQFRLRAHGCNQFAY